MDLMPSWKELVGFVFTVLPLAFVFIVTDYEWWQDLLIILIYAICVGSGIVILINEAVKKE